MQLMTNNNKTMNSEELAILLNMRHDNVRQAAINLQSHGVISFTEISVKGKGRPKQVMEFNERNSIIIAAKLNDKFLAAVIDRWQELEANQVDMLKRDQSRRATKLEARFLTDALKYDKKEDIKHYHFSNEFNLINKTVLGMNAKQYRIEHNLEPNQNIRDTLTKCEIEAIEHMQRLDTGMIELGYDYAKRKSELCRIFLTRHNNALCAEVKLLES
tara:strand:+ start:132 stop:779 length:648 start_codon:yes stop_codon:yes gene_type:complete